eukprot:528739_1
MTNSEYLNRFIVSLTSNTKIWLNMVQIEHLQSDLKQLFVTDSAKFGKFILYLKNKCDVKIFPVFLTNWIMSGATFDLINRVTKKYDNIELHGLPITLHASIDQQILFRPRITKIRNLFEVEMQLIKTGYDLPIKLHINVECQEWDNYYTLLHPRLMDAKHYNKLNITLPTTESKVNIDSISLKMSIMLHNFEHFKMDYDEIVSASSTYVTQQMIQTPKSYLIADCFSFFYGISNTIISICDSITDIGFILFLCIYIIPRQDETFGSAFLILSLGNLISVSIIIAIYMMHQINVSTTCQQIGYFCLFFVLSPVLASIEWLKKCRKIEHDVLLIVYPSCDGILLWFQQELIRNKVFIFESLFESCF